MSAEARKTMTELNRKISTDLRAFANEFVHQLKTTTPIATGYARNSWRNIYTGKTLGTGGKIPLAQNDAPYIGVLDGRSPRGKGWSSQAPDGIVEPALAKTRKK